ncbi:basic amino acid/polyamine antiporter [Ihubacter massiliensis]|uniref:Basic amino acid/polyamine antiporter n=1 Tax=Hominibacterium faecale TaxID=2839743 RepID=A0A9J6QLG0_9FIRM|nr:MULTISPECIES: basic amino acid/polyamine antiporter [Eubacteriales Family XIII. Incertae Sedis]MCI7301585.1 basic amino acid/polyamine antiporter [Clostridia bacterium]MCO7121984.1 basic amino acid/polyamine antiporter [Ihubacter massiliensis]MCU7376738.1 basic amino acid/polyamine antiporter [Hominibacterium faecale]MDY3013467.1 basic amino acid/polyamine antiporter [Clostridiales Family XIII bacterium]
MGNSNEKGLGTLRLTMFGIGLILASGAFAIPGDFASSGAYPLASLIGWGIAGIGMLSLCMCFFRLGIAKPELTSGLYTYAREGFGEFIGFCSAWGYWISAILAQISFITMLFSSLGSFFPVFGEGNNVASIVTASVIIWLIALLVSRGINQAVTINVVVVIAKLLPILVLLVAIVFARAFDPSVFFANFTGEGVGKSLLEQVKGTTFITVWIFIGIEGSVVISERAKNTKVAGRATLICFLCMLALYMMISILSMGVMPTEELAALKTPSVAGVLQAVVGDWGAMLVNIAVIISIAGALFTYTILCVDSAYAPASKGCFPKFFARLNRRGAPVTSLLLSTVVIQIFLVIIYFNAATYQVCYALSTSMIMFPYFLSGLYCLKITIKGETLTGPMESGTKASVWIFAVIGAVYGAWMLYASGWQSVLASAVLFGPGILLYLYTQKQKGVKVLPKTTDAVAVVVVLAAFVAAIILMANGTIQLF